MKCKIPEISWHNRDPVLSVDIQSKNVENTIDTYRLASAGTDGHVLIWFIKLVDDDADINLELAADLTRHQRAVNVVKWSPNGEFLASGDDESVIFIWKQKTDTDPPNILENTTEGDKEVWLTLKILRGHMEDVYDLSWSPNSQFIVSGSVDNSAIIWDINKGKSTAILRDHKGFVQGVAWDPCNQYVATLSTDRYLRVFDLQTKRVLQRINKGSLNVPEGHPLYGKNMRLFHDDTLQTFFRRLSFTPDGKLLLTPSGVTDFEGCTKPLHTTYGFSRYSFRQPALILPCPDQYTVGVSCCPILFSLRPYNADVNPPVVPLPYRMIFAIATRSSVYFYDTQQHQPFAIISNIHYTRLTDITWSSDGRVVVVSSTDGFCSLITFEKGELGEEYEKMQEILNSVCLTNDLGNKKSKKQKENDSQEPKSRKSSTDVAPIKHTTKAQSFQATTLKEITEVNEKLEEKMDTLQIESNRTSKDEKNSVSEQPKEVTPKKTSLPMVKPLVAAEIILDKEILSSDEKFESPEKKLRPVTPITVRRRPRTPTSAQSTPSTTVLSISNLPVETLKSSPSTAQLQEIITPSKNLQKSTAKPIAIRRTPRAIIPAPSPVDSPTVLEEAMDAWPTRIPPSPPSNEENSSLSKKPASKEEKTSPIKAESMRPAVSETTSDRTEDIRLIYEDTQEEPIESSRIDDLKDAHLKSVQAAAAAAALIEENKDNVAEQSQTAEVPAQGTPKQIKSGTPTQNKTPRRVQLTTISTPKSKKKLL